MTVLNGVVGRPWKEWRPHAREHARELLEQRWCRPLTAAGVRHRAEMITGASKALIEFATSQETDLIVVGRRGRGDSLN